MSRSFRRQRSADIGVSLFPFLAVLICTMGALIVLLVITVQQSGQANRAAAEQSDDVEPEPVVVVASPPSIDPEQLAELRTSEEDLRWHIEMLNQGREKTLQRLQQQQAELGMVEDQSRDLKSNLEQLRDEVELLKSALQDGLQQQDGHQERLAAARVELAAAIAEQERLDKSPPSRRRSYAIVPYQGQHGTRRRPVFVECTADQVIFQPSGVTLTSQDLSPPFGSNNVLAAALRAVREYLLDAGVAKSSSEAYPLLIVRPGGEYAYDACRTALEDWDHDFGYELIAEDIELAYPDPDPAITERLEQTVRGIRQLRAQLGPTAPRQQELSIWSPGGGFRRTDGGPGTRRKGRGSTGSGQAKAFGSSAAAALPPGTPPTAAADGQRGSGFTVAAASGAPAAASGLAKTTSARASTPAQTDDATQPGDATLPSDPTQATDRGGDSAGAVGAAATALAGAATNADASGGPGGPLPIGMSQSRGADWALPESTLGAIGVVRPVLATCTDSQVILHPEKQTGETQAAIPFDISGTAATQQLVAALQQRMRGWGIAGTGMYWRPLLEMEVTLDGEQRFAQLSALLHGSGLEIRRR